MPVCNFITSGGARIKEGNNKFDANAKNCIAAVELLNENKFPT